MYNLQYMKCCTLHTSGQFSQLPDIGNQCRNWRREEDILHLLLYFFGGVVISFRLQFEENKVNLFRNWSVPGGVQINIFFFSGHAIRTGEDWEGSGMAVTTQHQPHGHIESEGSTDLIKAHTRDHGKQSWDEVLDFNHLDDCMIVDNSRLILARTKWLDTLNFILCGLFGCPGRIILDSVSEPYLRSSTAESTLDLA
ncbi:hypothetical protein BV898_14902 [Hypsibius exemplaris]|uniref:Uncharacterized protein n=1 Tax=Hypsibius exemplaris TaxID=2072580 RepID=A0A9X6NBW8_HYPEX|nr:hypothetical protein BV898_14902 [Hypsibius exemplaris]